MEQLINAWMRHLKYLIKGKFTIDRQQKHYLLGFDDFRQK